MNDSGNYPNSAVNYPWLMDSRNKRGISLDLKKPDILNIWQWKVLKERKTTYW